MKTKLSGSLRALPLALAFVGVCLAVPAQAVLVDFEDIAFAIGRPIVTSTASRGFTFTSGHHHEIDETDTAGLADDGTQYILEEGGGLGTPITMALTGGGTFSLGSISAAEVFISAPGGFPNATFINLLGNLFGGGTVSASFALDGIIDGPGGLADFQTFVLPGTFTGLTSVVFSGSIPGATTNAAISIDNLNTAPGQVVPEPMTLALLVPALLGLAWSRRR